MLCSLGFKTFAPSSALSYHTPESIKYRPETLGFNCIPSQATSLQRNAMGWAEAHRHNNLWPASQEGCPSAWLFYMGQITCMLCSKSCENLPTTKHLVSHRFFYSQSQKKKKSSRWKNRIQKKKNVSCNETYWKIKSQDSWMLTQIS